jgi:hypothetical protein
MDDKKALSCPKCGLALKSTSGWTLHVKTCCPEERYKRTTVKMMIEFEVPVALDGTHVVSKRQRWILKDAKDFGAVKLFQLAFRNNDIPEVGVCELKVAGLLDKQISKRPPTYQECNRAVRAKKDGEKVAVVAEFKRVICEIIGDANLKISTDASEYPTAIFHLYTDSVANPIPRWEILNNTLYSFTFMVGKTRVSIGKGPWLLDAYPRVHRFNRNFNLADPKSFDAIKKWMKLPSPVVEE